MHVVRFTHSTIWLFVYEPASLLSGRSLRVCYLSLIDLHFGRNCVQSLFVGGALASPRPEIRLV